VFLALQVPLPGQAIDPRLASLEPLLNREWRGMMKAPDGGAEWEVVCTYEAVWDGKAVKYARTSAEQKSFEEGTIYWDDPAGRIAFFSIHSSGAFSSGSVSREKDLIVFEGRMTMPARPPSADIKQSFDFRNTFEVTSEAEMVDRWFQNAFGPWRPGHVISFKARKNQAGSGPAASRSTTTASSSRYGKQNPGRAIDCSGSRSPWRLISNKP
jgi:hypothetical protein